VITVLYKSDKGKDDILGVAQPALSLWTIGNVPIQPTW
jgi:hypothetical protein